MASRTESGRTATAGAIRRMVRPMPWAPAMTASWKRSAGPLLAGVAGLGVAALSPTRAAADVEPAEVSAGLRALSLADALAYARAHQPDLRAAVAHLGALRAQAEVPRSQWYPTLGVTAQAVVATANNSTGTYLSIPAFDNPRISATRAVSSSSASLAPHPSTLLGAGLSQEVFDFGRITAQAAADDMRADAQRLSAEATRLLVEYEVEESFFAVFTAKSLLDAAERAYARAAVHRDLARVGVGTGLRRPIELTRAEAMLDRYDLDRVRGRLGVSVAQSVFAAAVGVPEALLDISGEPPAPGDLPALGGALAGAASRGTPSGWRRSRGSGAGEADLGHRRRGAPQPVPDQRHLGELGRRRAVEREPALRPRGIAHGAQLGRRPGAGLAHLRRDDRGPRRRVPRRRGDAARRGARREAEARRPPSSGRT